MSPTIRASVRVAWDWLTCWWEFGRSPAGLDRKIQELHEAHPDLLPNPDQENPMAPTPEPPSLADALLEAIGLGFDDLPDGWHIAHPNDHPLTITIADEHVVTVQATFLGFDDNGDLTRTLAGWEITGKPRIPNLDQETNQ